MTEQVEAPPPNALLPRRTPIRRAGCILALVIWFAILLLPCFLIVMAVQGEISISTGSAPGQQTRLWLVSEADERGLGISTASARQSDPNAVCVVFSEHSANTTKGRDCTSLGFPDEH